MELKEIKLIIWDLDETLWQGTISEEEIVVHKHIVEFINNTLDAGIVHSICSKNDFNVIKDKLEREKLWDLFVFPSIDWCPKGSRIKGIIDDIGLRPVNVLFIDDNVQNLKEAEYFCPGIRAIPPLQLLQTLEAEAKVIKKIDLNRKRLAQYKVLENKREASKNYTSNIDFLNNSGIKVDIIEDCVLYKERIFELMMRSNQLNYTKFRQDRESFELMLKNPNIRKGVVKVKDNFGDYGIVGFFAIKGNKAIHYFFSCRTLGMLVEQYVYMKIGCPQIDIIGDVITSLNCTNVPEWINRQENSKTLVNKSEINHKVLFKGPCDLLQVFSFIKKSDFINTEFSYVNEKGTLIEGYNHTSQIVTALCLTENEKKDIVQEIPWFDEGMLETDIINPIYDYVFLSLITDASCATYRRKGSKIIISLCEKFYDLTEEANWDAYIEKKIYGENIKFTRENLTDFSDKYEYIPYDNGVTTIKNLDFIIQHLKENTKLVLMLGTERTFSGDHRESYKDRAEEHRILNEKIKKWARDKNNVQLLFYDDFIHSESDYVDSIDHYVKRVYYDVANEILNIINGSKDNEKIRIRNRFAIFVESLIARVKRVIRKCIG